ncbi:MAG: putative FmdB family regulatory protein, partial [Verrucomicrobiales bacterium]
MPTYDYHCEKCDKTFEFFQTMTDDRLTECQDEACRGKVKRLIGTGAGLLFKGSGFYITDYRSDNYKAGAKSESGKSESGKSESGKSDSGKSDSKKTGSSGTKPSGSGSS